MANNSPQSYVTPTLRTSRIPTPTQNSASKPKWMPPGPVRESPYCLSPPQADSGATGRSVVPRRRSTMAEVEARESKVKGHSTSTTPSPIPGLATRERIISTPKRSQAVTDTKVPGSKANGRSSSVTPSSTPVSRSEHTGVPKRSEIKAPRTIPTRNSFIPPQMSVNRENMASATRKPIFMAHLKKDPKIEVVHNDDTTTRSISSPGLRDEQSKSYHVRPPLAIHAYSSSEMTFSSPAIHGSNEGIKVKLLGAEQNLLSPLSRQDSLAHVNRGQILDDKQTLEQEIQHAYTVRLSSERLPITARSSWRYARSSGGGVDAESECDSTFENNPRDSLSLLSMSSTSSSSSSVKDENDQIHDSVVSLLAAEDALINLSSPSQSPSPSPCPHANFSSDALSSCSNLFLASSPTSPQSCAQDHRSPQSGQSSREPITNSTSSNIINATMVPCTPNSLLHILTCTHKIMTLEPEHCGRNCVPLFPPTSPVSIIHGSHLRTTDLDCIHVCPICQLLRTTTSTSPSKPNAMQFKTSTQLHARFSNSHPPLSASHSQDLNIYLSEQAQKAVTATKSIISAAMARTSLEMGRMVGEERDLETFFQERFLNSDTAVVLDLRFHKQREGT